MKKHIPNCITLLNLSAGVIAILFATQNHLEEAAYFVFLGIILDFFDGFLARLLKVQSELGVQLDSMADMVTSGVVPGIVMFQLLLNTGSDWNVVNYLSNFPAVNYVPFLGIMLTLAAGYRLAKFNIDDRQDHDFIGMPTPALALFVLSLPLISVHGSQDWAISLVENPYFLVIVTLLGSYLMNCNLPLFSLKFHSILLKDNWEKFLFMLVSIILILVFQITAVPIIIIFYIFLSMVHNLVEQKTRLHAL